MLYQKTEENFENKIKFGGIQIMLVVSKKEDVYWKLIESAKWETDHDYNRIQLFYKTTLNSEEYKELGIFVNEKTDELYKKYEKDWLGNPGIDCGDDSWSDLLAEVVGRGKKFYKSITVNKLRKMADKNDYQESFHYCFH